MNCCCCCPPDNGDEQTTETLRSLTSSVTPFGPSPISQRGVLPNLVQIVSPDLFMRNERHEESLESGRGCRTTGHLPDPLYPSDPDSVCNAMTPVFRNGQIRWLNIIRAHSDHSPTASSPASSNNTTPPTFYTWDGTPFPVYSPTSLTTAQKQQYRKDWYKFIFPNFPNDFIIRGLKQLYDDKQPFANPAKPTVSEFESWNYEVLNLFRRMSGLPEATASQELVIMCQWTQERKTTNMWDAKYPGTFDSAYGRCLGGTNLHCGTTFKPSDIEDQKPYWNDYFCGFPCVKPHALSTLNQGTEAITVWYNGNASTAMSRNLRKQFEGAASGTNPSTGHSGPYLARPLVGLWVGRSKWAGSSFSPPSGFSY